MPALEESAVKVLRDLRELGYGCALVGGLAVGVRARPRTTLDVDFAVAVESDAEAEATAADTADESVFMNCLSSMMKFAN